MILISNTSPIIALAKIEYLYLLNKLNFQKILIPPIVKKELWAKLGAESTIIEQALDNYIFTQTPQQLPQYIQNNISHLDAGEKQVIELALSIEEEHVVLLDDKAGRKAAQSFHLSILGTVGILLLAKKHQHIQSVTELLVLLRQKQYWLSGGLIKHVKKIAKE
jgi:predicted nucleic acid-binding protein